MKTEQYYAIMQHTRTNRVVIRLAFGKTPEQAYSYTRSWYREIDYTFVALIKKADNNSYFTMPDINEGSNDDDVYTTD